MIDIERVVGIEVVDDTHHVPLHAVLLQQLYATHHLVEGGLSATRTAVFIVKLLGAVDGEADEPVVLVEELTPLVGEQGAVGLEAVVNLSSAGVAALQLQHFLVEAERAHQRLATVPGEKHLRLCLRFDILLDERLQRGVTHQRVGLIGLMGLISLIGLIGPIIVQCSFLQIIAVLAGEVADAAYRLCHDIQGGGERGKHLRFMVKGLWLRVDLKPET